MLPKTKREALDSHAERHDRNEDSADGVDRRPSDRAYIRNNRIVAACVLFFGLSMAAVSLSYGLVRDGLPAPGLYPFIVSASLVPLSLAWLVTGGGPPENDPAVVDDVASLADIADLDGAATRESARGNRAETNFSRITPGMIRIGLTVGITAITMSIMDIVGYVPAMTFCAAALLIVVARHGIAWSIVGAVVGSVLTKLLFFELGLSLPNIPLDLPWHVL